MTHFVSDLLLRMMNGTSMPFYPSDGDTRLHVSAYEGRVLELIQLLNGENDTCDVNRTVLPLGVTPLRLAATRGWTLCCKSLLHYKADIDKVDRKGQTPLFCSVKNHSLKVVRLLLHHGASPNGSSLNRMTPLEALLSEDYNDSSVYPIFMTLLKYGADADCSERKKSLQRCMLCSLLLLQNPLPFLSAYYEFGGRLRVCDCKARKVEKEMQKKEDAKEIHDVIGEPLCLKSLCRIAVRKQFGWKRLDDIKQLSLPDVILSFLMYDEFPF